jgi:hypothetical protein
MNDHPACSPVNWNFFITEVTKYKVMKNKMVGHVGYMGEMYTIFLLENLQGKRLHVRSRHKWEDNIRMDLREIG